MNFSSTVKVFIITQEQETALHNELGLEVESRLTLVDNRFSEQ